MAALIRTYNWATTPLGPIERWPQSLRSMVDLVLGSPLPMVVLWGAEHIRIYNDAYRQLSGVKHPSGLGKTMRDVWPEIWEFAAPIYEAVLRGEARSLLGQKLTTQRHATPEDEWFDLIYSPLRDESGKVAGILLTAFEITTGERTKEKLRYSAERERVVLESVSDAVFALDAGWRFTLFNRAAEAYFGLSRETVLGRHVTDVFPAGAGSIFEEYFHKVMEAGETVTFVAPAVAIPGRLLELRAGSMDGGVAVSFSDVTERKRTEEALRASEEQLRLVTDTVPALIAYVDKAQRYQFINKNYIQWFGLEREQIIGRTMRELLGERLYPRLQPYIEAALAGKSVNFDSVVSIGDVVDVHGDGVARHFNATYVPRFASDRRTIGFYILIVDVTERKRAEAAQQTLVAELQHRTRNLLAVIRAISTQTLRTSKSLDEFSHRFNNRLSALGRVQSLLSRGSGHSVMLRELLESELVAHGTSTGNQKVTVKGPDVQLPSPAVQVLALALHELATNAAKYGALMQNQARISIVWDLTATEDQCLLTIRWSEMGVKLPSVQGSAKRGFGRQLIERALPYDLGAETCFSFADDGVRCEIRVPLNSPQVSQ